MTETRFQNEILEMKNFYFYLILMAQSNLNNKR